MQITCNKILLHFISTDFFQNLNLSYNASDFILTSPLYGRKSYCCLLLFWFMELIQLTHGARESGSATTAGVWRVYSWWCPDSKLRTPSNMSNYQMCQGWELNTACIMAIALLSIGTIWKSVSYYVLTLPQASQGFWGCMMQSPCPQYEARCLKPSWRDKSNGHWVNLEGKQYLLVKMVFKIRDYFFSNWVFRRTWTGGESAQVQADSKPIVSFSPNQGAQSEGVMDPASLLMMVNSQRYLRMGKAFYVFKDHCYTSDTQA